ncbi:SDR family NAD(P)-dependent oxidoreductase, partial [Angustibacter aerolatus]
GAADDGGAGGGSGADAEGPGSSGAGPPLQPASSAVAPPRRSTQPVRRRVLRLIEAERPGLAAGGLWAGPVVVVDDGAGVAQLLVAGLTSAGVRATVVAEPPPGAHGVVDLGALAPVDSPADARTVQRDLLRRARDAALVRPGGLFVVVHDTGGDLGLRGAGDRAWLGGVADATRTLALEWPQATVRSIDCTLAGRTRQQVADALLAELVGGGGTPVCGLPADGRRLVPVLLDAPLGDVGHPGPLGPLGPLGPQPVVVVSGGARGVTAAVVRDLARRHRPRLLLLGRTELVDEPAGLVGADDERELVRRLATRPGAGGLRELAATGSRVLAVREVRTTLDAVTEAGSPVRYADVDVRDPEAVAAAVDAARETWGPVTAVLHGAGVLADGPLAAASDAELDAVLDTKLLGLDALLAATRDDPLRTVVAFSSVAALVGNPGQSAYAAANGAVQQVLCAEQTARPGCLVRAVAWGPWRGGMVHGDVVERLDGAGVPLLDPDAAVDSLHAELAAERADDDVVVALTADPPTDASSTSPLDVARVARPGAAEVLVSAATHPELLDHAVGGLPVLPLARSLGWLLAHAGDGAAPLVVDDVRVYATTALPGLAAGGTHLLRLVASAPITGDPHGTELTLHAADGRPRVRAVLAPASEPLDVDPVPTDEPAGLRPLDRAPLYDGHVLFHGPAWQVLQPDVARSAHGASGRIEPVAGATGALDPAALDGALQLAVLWAEGVLGAASLPMAVERCVVHRFGRAEGELRVVVHAREVHAAGARCDVVLVDPDGAPRVQLVGVELIRRPA